MTDVAVALYALGVAQTLGLFILSDIRSRVMRIESVMIKAPARSNAHQPS